MMTITIMMKCLKQINLNEEENLLKKATDNKTPSSESNEGINFSGLEELRTERIEIGASAIGRKERNPITTPKKRNK